MITLGINAAYHDSAAALVIDGVPLAASEEERFSRIKHAKRPLPFSAWELPFNAIADCLDQAGLTLAAVDHVAYSFDPALFAARRADLQPGADGRIAVPFAPAALQDPRLAAWDSPWDPLFLSHIVNAPLQLQHGAPHHRAQRLHGSAARSNDAPRWQWHWVSHHLCHQASAFLAAPFDSCAVMTLDGRGERNTTSYGVWQSGPDRGGESGAESGAGGGRYRALGAVQMPHSLGLLYERATTHLGFLHSSDEYKVMALAAMGTPRWAGWLAERVLVGSHGRFEVATFDFAVVAGPPRVPGTPLEQRHFDLAASLQAVLENTALQLARWLHKASGQRQLALAGGVALNCLMNARLRDEGPFDAVWIQPAAGDAGTALGAALWVDGRARLTPEVSGIAGTAGAPADDGKETASDGVALAPRRWQMDHAHLGPAWRDDQVQALLHWAGVPFQALPDEAALVERTASLLARGAIVGWFQGRMEWGPRALGARSILASPTDPAMQQRLNGLKDREDFRPVAPAIAAESFADWFTPAHRNGGRSPFMLFTFQVLPQQAARIPSACHSDGSARVQTVDAASQPRFHALLRAFERHSGVPVLVNTSFNVRGEPVVCSPKDALEAYIATPLDALVIGNCVLTKKDWP